MSPSPDNTDRLTTVMKRSVRSHTAALIQGVLLMTAAPLAAAYIGPGSGISVIGSLLGLLATILITVGAIALFPFRKMMKKRAASEGPEEAEEEFSAETGQVTVDSSGSDGVNTK